MTARQYIDEVKLRLARHQVMMTIGDVELLTMVNDARHKVAQDLSGVYPEFYSKIWKSAALTDGASELPDFQVRSRTADLTMIGTVLPTDFYREKVVFINYEVGGRLYCNQARYMTKQEMVSVNKNTWLPATVDSPIYTIDRAADGTYRMIIAGLKSSVYSLFDSATNIIAEVWYVANLNYLDTWGDVDITTPAQFKELVILYAMLTSMQTIHNTQLMGLLSGQIQLFKNKLRMVYAQEYASDTVLLPSKEGL